MAANLHISISAEPLFSVAGLTISNSIFTSLIVSGLLISFAILVRLQLKPTSRPSGLQNLAEMIIEALYGLVHGITGDTKRTRVFFPLVASFMLFILFNNWIGLVPGVGTIGFYEGKEALLETSAPAEHSGLPIAQVQAVTEDASHEAVSAQEAETTHEEVVAADHESDSAGETHHATFVPLLRPGTADLNTTLALALLSVFSTQVFGVYFLGASYFKKFINLSNPINFYVGVLETISEFAKILSFAFRLFGNIFAGEVLLVVIGSLVPVVIPMPFYGLEIFVGFIQALVFSMLSLVFFNMATHSHDEH